VENDDEPKDDGFLDAATERLKRVKLEQAARLAARPSLPLTSDDNQQIVDGDRDAMENDDERKDDTFLDAARLRLEYMKLAKAGRAAAQTSLPRTDEEAADTPLVVERSNFSNDEQQNMDARVREAGAFHSTTSQLNLNRFGQWAVL
jgi:hypothetical protein